MITGLLIGVSAIGFTLFIMNFMHPLFNMLFFDWMGAILMLVPPIGFAIRLKTSTAQTQFEKLPRGTNLIEFLRREGSAVDLRGRRVFAGESFLDVPYLGLIEDLGKDCVYLKGDKKKRFGLENINYTPQPTYWNYTAELHKLGFEDNYDVYEVLNGKNLELMGKVYLRMKMFKDDYGAKKLFEQMQQHKPRKRIRFSGDPGWRRIGPNVKKSDGDGSMDKRERMQFDRRRMRADRVREKKAVEDVDSSVDSLLERLK